MPLEDAAELGRIVLYVVRQNVGEDRGEKREIEGVIRVRETEIGFVVNVDVLKSEMRMARCDRSLAPGDAARHNVEAVVTASTPASTW